MGVARSVGAMRFALIPSPFVGPSCWRGVAAVLDDACAVDYGGVSGPDWFDGAARRIAAQVDHRPWIAVLHSSAGPFAPSLAAVSYRLQGLVFVDAVLPHPGRSPAQMAPSAQIDALRKTAADGLLARWDKWLPPEVLEAWVPDPAARAALLPDMPRVPFAFLDAEVPDDARWEGLPAAYIRLSEGYEPQTRRAEARGWTVSRLASNHLGMVSNPAELAAAIAQGLPNISLR